VETLDVPLGKILSDAGDTIQFVYFPHNAVLSLLAVLSDGSTAEMATMGREGMIGLIETLGDGISQGRCIVQAAGTVSRVRAKYLRQQIEASASVRTVMFRYLQFLFTQILQVGVCSAVHPVEARFCRLLLTMYDCIGGDDLPLTHEFLAGMLGVHRPAVSTVARHLQDEGLIKQGRGVMIVTERAHLEESLRVLQGNSPKPHEAPATSP
jgi:CRP-like cAMP-binding protein